MKAKFGRIPTDTYSFLEQAVTSIKNEVVIALPDSASDELRAFTLEKILDTVFKDWQQHGNDKLSGEDLNDLRSFVQAAAALAGPQLNAQNKPIYKAILQGLLDDWLFNWNAKQPGPPNQR